MSPSKPPILPPEDAALWAHITHDVTPLKGKKPVEVAAETPLVTAPALTARPKKTPVLPHLANRVDIAVTPQVSGTGIDRNTRSKLERGQMQIEAILDLHGNNYDVAQLRLQAFIEQGFSLGQRCVLVITGKGSGILKSGFLDWISRPALKGRVLHVYPAQGKHGGGGAFYVLLRRKR